MSVIKEDLGAVSVGMQAADMKWSYAQNNLRIRRSAQLLAQLGGLPRTHVPQSYICTLAPLSIRRLINAGLPLGVARVRTVSLGSVCLTCP